MHTGIYAIEHADSGRVYVGSAVNFDARWRVHLHHLKKGTHHSAHLQSAWNKYGEVAFLFKRLLVCSHKNMLMYEQRALDGYKSFDRKFGFNVCAFASSRLGTTHSAEARAKIKAKRATQVFSAETRALLSKVHKGRKMPDWFPAFISNTRTGVKLSAEARKNMSLGQRGRKWDVAVIEKRKTSKLTQEIADEIRATYAKGGVTQKALGLLYKIDQSIISGIVTGKRWTSSLPFGERNV